MSNPPAVGPLVYMGTPEVAVPPLVALVGAGFDVALVVTNPDVRRGRGNKTSASPVKAAAVELGLPVSHDPDDVLGSGASLGVVVAYGHLIRDHVLAAVPMVNLHFSLLPRWRGAAPVERTILAGDVETGVCLIDVVSELDAGGIRACVEKRLDGTETLEGLRSELVNLGSALLVDALRDGLPPPVPQQGEIVWARKITADDVRLDFSDSAEALLRRIRVGRAHTTLRGRRFLIHAAELVAADDAEPPDLDQGQVDAGLVGTGEGLLRLVEVQPEGKPRRSASDWINGANLAADDRLGA